MYPNTRQSYHLNDLKEANWIGMGTYSPFYVNSTSNVYAKAIISFCGKEEQRNWILTNSYNISLSIFSFVTHENNYY